MPRDCSEDSCTQDASDSPKMGPYAGKCPVHRAAARQRMLDGRREGRERREEVRRDSGPPATPTSRETTLVAATADLHRVAKGLEDKVARKRTATGAAKAALSEFNDALNAVKQAAEQLLAG